MKSSQTTAIGRPLGFSFGTSVILPAAAFVGAITMLVLLKLAMVDAGALAIDDLDGGRLPVWKVEMMFSFLWYANIVLFVFQLLACCLLAWWTIRLARAIGENVPLTHEAGWYGNVWCLPISNLWLPFEGLRELWLRTGRYTRFSRLLLGSAWAAWVGHQLLCILGLLPLQPQSTTGQCWWLGLWMLRDLVFVGGSILGIVVVLWLTVINDRIISRMTRDRQAETKA